MNDVGIRADFSEAFFVAWFFRHSVSSGTLRSGNRTDLEHLRSFAGSRSGIEAFLEPRTAVTDTTLVLVAADGEWTRRRIGGPEAAERFTRALSIPLYEAARVGYPRRMRDWTARRNATGTSTERT